MLSGNGSNGGVAQASNVQSGADPESDAARALHQEDTKLAQMRTTTINVTPSLRNRMISAAHQQMEASSAIPVTMPVPASPLSQPIPQVREQEPVDSASASANSQEGNRRPMNYIDRPRFPEPRPRTW